MNAWMAAEGSDFHSCLKASSVMPDTLAKSVSAWPPVSTATCILIIAFENAVPPAWASKPTEERAAAKPRICASDNPTCAPAEAMLVAMFMMADSVVA